MEFKALVEKLLSSTARAHEHGMTWEFFGDHSVTHHNYGRFFKPMSLENSSSTAAANALIRCVRFALVAGPDD